MMALIYVILELGSQLWRYLVEENNIFLIKYTSEI